MFKRVYSNIGASLVFRSFGVGFTLLLNFLIAKYCLTEGYGIFYQGLSLFTIIATIGKFGLDNLSLIKTSEYNSKKEYEKIRRLLKAIYKFIIPVVILLMILLFFTSDLIAVYYFKDEKLALPLKIFFLALLPFILLQVNSESLKGFLRIKQAAFLQGFFPLFLATILGLFFYKFYRADVVGFIMGYAVSFWLVFIISLILGKTSYELKNETEPKDAPIKIKKLLKATNTFWTIASVGIISTNIVALILGYFLDSAVIGIYGAAAKVSLLISFILPSINSAMAPEFVKSIVDKDYKLLEQLAKKSSLIMSLVSIPMVLFMVIFSGWIMSFFGEGFVSGKYILAILSIGQLINAVTGSVGYILMSARLEKYLLYSLLLSLGLSLILCVILIPPYGIFGAAIAVASSIAFQNLFSSYICYKKLSIVPLFFIKNSVNE